MWSWGNSVKYHLRPHIIWCLIYEIQPTFDRQNFLHLRLPSVWIPMCCHYTKKWLETVIYIYIYIYIYTHTHTHIYCEICALLEFYVVQNGSFLPVFPSSRVKGLRNSWRWGKLVVLKHHYKTTMLQCAKSQQGADHSASLISCIIYILSKFL
jgi:hypothetical protein